MRSVSKVRKVIFILGIFTAVLFPLFPQKAAAATPYEIEQACQSGKGAELGYSCYGQVQAAVADGKTVEQGVTDAKLPPDASAQFGNWIAQIIYVFTVGLGSVVAAIAAGILSLAVKLSLDSAAYGLDFVSLGWTMVRDIANMAFIFILVYIAIQVMFLAQTHGTMERLVKVLAVALIINFSFFGTRVVIDAGNLISVQFYNAIVSKHSSDSNFVLPFGVQTGIQTPDLTGSIMQGINFVSVIGPDTFKSATTGGNPLSNFVTSLIFFSLTYIALGAALFMLAAAFITAGVKFVVRIVMLWFSIITAPLALVMWAFSSGHGGGHGGHGFSFGSWLKNLVSHAFYPAIFLFVLLLISNFMGAQGDSGLGGGLIQGAVNNFNGSFGDVIAAIINIAVRLAFVLVMLYFALKASDYFDVVGGSLAKTWGNNFAFGFPGWAGRTVLGGGSRFIDKRFNKDVEGVPPSPTFRKLADFAAKQSFDVRTPGSKIPGLKDRLEKDYGKPGGEGGFDEAKHHKEAAAKKAIEAEVKKINDHGSSVVDEIRAQAKFQREYDLKYGTGALNRKIKELTHNIEKSRHEANELMVKAVNGEATQKEVKDKQSETKGFEGQLKTLTGTGKREAEAHDKQHKEEYAITLMASGNVKKYLIGQKVLNGKSSAQKIKDAVKESDDEDKGGEGDEKKGGGSHGPTGGGSAPAAPSHGPAPTAPAAH